MQRNHFVIVQALCRCALVDPSDATRHQVERLKNELFSDGFKDEADTLNRLLNPTDEMSGQKIIRSESTP